MDVSYRILISNPYTYFTILYLVYLIFTEFMHLEEFGTEPHLELGHSSQWPRRFSSSIETVTQMKER